jgi:hypothetical protein
LEAWIPVFTGMKAEGMQDGTHLRKQALAGAKGLNRAQLAWRILESWLNLQSS